MAGVTPTPGAVHYDRPLSNFAVRAFADSVEEQGLIGQKIFPLIPSDKPVRPLLQDREGRVF